MSTTGSANVFTRFFIALAPAMLFLHGLVAPGAIDLSVTNSTDQYLVLAELTPVGLGLWFLALTAWFVAAAYCSPPPENGRPAGLFRRFVAFLIDFTICLFLVIITAAMVVLLLEVFHTGAFSWRVERDVARSTDAIAFVAGVGVLLVVLVLYAMPAWRGRQSPGGVVTGIFLRRAAPLTLGQALGRSFLGYVTLCAMFISVPMALMRGDRRMWHDLYFGTSVQTG